MMTRDFADRTRARVAEARTALTKLREVSKETIRQLDKLDKQHVTDRGRVYDRLGALADDVVDKLPEEATDGDSDRAYALQEQINDLAADVEEISFAASATEDLGGLVGDTINEAYASLRETEAKLAKVERLAAKLGL